MEELPRPPLFNSRKKRDEKHFWICNLGSWNLSLVWRRNNKKMDAWDSSLIKAAYKTVGMLLCVSAEVAEK